MNITVEHPKNDYYIEIRVYPNSVVIVRTLKKEIDINRNKIGFK